MESSLKVGQVGDLPLARRQAQRLSRPADRVAWNPHFTMPRRCQPVNRHRPAGADERPAQSAHPGEFASRRLDRALMA